MKTLGQIAYEEYKLQTMTVYGRIRPDWDLLMVGEK